jgi:hypothetical protein
LDQDRGTRSQTEERGGQTEGRGAGHRDVDEREGRGARRSDAEPDRGTWTRERDAEPDGVMRSQTEERGGQTVGLNWPVIDWAGY